MKNGGPSGLAGAQREAVQQVSLFKEMLPGGCPVDEARNLPEQVVVRLVSREALDATDFASHAALGKSRPDEICPCKWSSCSVFGGRKGLQTAIDMVALPRYRKRFSHLAHLQIDGRSGLGVVNDKSGHIDLWMFSSFDPVSAVVRCEQVT